jgi:hypothetical protein
MATYAVIGPRELQQNITTAPGTPGPITTLYTQIENAVDLAQDSVPISEAAQISSAITNLTATGLFRQEVTRWNRSKPAIKRCCSSRLSLPVSNGTTAGQSPRRCAGSYAALKTTQDRDAAHAAAAEERRCSRAYQENATIARPSPPLPPGQLSAVSTVPVCPGNATAPRRDRVTVTAVAQTTDQLTPG